MEVLMKYNVLVFSKDEGCEEELNSHFKDNFSFYFYHTQEEFFDALIEEEKTFSLMIVDLRNEELSLRDLIIQKRKESLTLFF